MDKKTNNSLPNVQQFWDKKYAQFDTNTIVSSEFPFRGAPNYTKEKFLELLGNVADKEVLEIGCGNGVISVYMAKKGARVTAVDIAENSINNTINLACNNQVKKSINAYQLNALELAKLNKKFDLVVGRFILHHIEPFEKFTLILSELMKENGRGVFIENNSRNPLLMLARNHLVGKLGIPKYGDEEEHPFEPKEIELLKQNVGLVKQYYPNFVFFSKVNVYIFKKNPKFQPMMNMLSGLDRLIEKYFPQLDRYSYRQVIEIYKQ